MPDTAASSRGTGRKANYLSWSLRVLLALLLLVQGLDKFGHRRLWVNLFATIGVGQWLRYFTGVLEVAGAALLFVPKATYFVVPMLLVMMTGALLSHVFIIGLGPQTVLVVGMVTALVTIYVRGRSDS